MNARIFCALSLTLLTSCALTKYHIIPSPRSSSNDLNPNSKRISCIFQNSINDDGTINDAFEQVFGSYGFLRIANHGKPDKRSEPCRIRIQYAKKTYDPVGDWLLAALTLYLIPIHEPAHPLYEIHLAYATPNGSRFEKFYTLSYESWHWIGFIFQKNMDSRRMATEIQKATDDWFYIQIPRASLDE